MHQECSSFNAQKEKKFTLIREYDPESTVPTLPGPNKKYTNCRMRHNHAAGFNRGSESYKISSYLQYLNHLC